MYCLKKEIFALNQQGLLTAIVDLQKVCWLYQYF